MWEKKRAKQRIYHCDPFTFGNSKAAIRLAETLNANKDPKVCERVSRLFHNSSAMFKELSSLLHKEIIMKLYYEHIITSIDKHKNWSSIVKSLTKNCLWAQYKKYIKNNLIIDIEELK